MAAFNQKTVLITGASSGIGAALAREFSKKGARLVLLARRVDRLDALARELLVNSTEVEFIACDVHSPAQLKLAVEKGVARFGGLDVVIANAGFGVAGYLDRLTVEDYQRQFETNVYGLLHTIYATLDELKKSKGTLALMGSVAGYVALPGNSPYSMSKAAVKALAESLRFELSSQGVSVVLISPGFVESEIRRVDNHGVLQPEAPEPIPSWLRMPTQKAAQKMIGAIAQRKREVIITTHGKLAVFMKRHFPWVIQLAMEKLNLKGRSEPKKSPQKLGTSGGGLKNS